MDIHFIKLFFNRIVSLVGANVEHKNSSSRQIPILDERFHEPKHATVYTGCWISCCWGLSARNESITLTTYLHWSVPVCHEIERCRFHPNVFWYQASET